MAHFSRRRSTALIQLLVGCMGLLAGCGTDDVGPSSRLVGGRCVITSDCVQRCLTGAAFPGGYCSVSCAVDEDCPGGATCVAAEGGVCLATCHGARACAAFGPTYGCGTLTSQSGGAAKHACVAP